MQPADSGPNPKLEYQSPSARPRSKAWDYLGRAILAVVLLIAAGVLFAVLWFITFLVSLGNAPMDGH